MSALAAPPGLAAGLAAIAEDAPRLDREPAFPAAAFATLAAAGALAPAAGPAEEWARVRAVARADGSVGRILDGHLNALERVDLLAPEPLRARHLSQAAAGERLLGVWGADPVGDEGAPAEIRGDALHGVKTFCSGAGGLHSALVVARDGEERRVAYVDLSAGVEVDRSWFAASGMRASESHRVVFHGARIHAVLGAPGELTREPWFGRDAIRTTATWAGLADAATAAAHDVLVARVRAGDEVAALALGRIGVHSDAVELWMAEAARRAEADPEASLLGFSVRLREAVARAATALVDEALRAAGSRPLVTGHPLDRAARDLRVFLLQHRLEPMLLRAGREAAGA